MFCLSVVFALLLQYASLDYQILRTNAFLVSNNIRTKFAFYRNYYLEAYQENVAGSQKKYSSRYQREGSKVISIDGRSIKEGSIIEYASSKGTKRLAIVKKRSGAHLEVTFYLILRYDLF